MCDKKTILTKNENDSSLDLHKKIISLSSEIEKLNSENKELLDANNTTIEEIGLLMAGSKN